MSIFISMCVYIAMDNRLKTMNSVRYELGSAGQGIWVSLCYSYSFSKALKFFFVKVDQM